MDLLFVDTETFGVPLDQTKSYKDIDNWPKIKQIAWLVYSKDGILKQSANYSVTNDILVPGTEEDYLRISVRPIHEILPCFLDSLSSCDVIIGHNIQYDVMVVLCELYRYGLDTDRLSNIQQFCTMKNSIEICGFDTLHGDRFPKLQELYSKLFHRPFENAHDAYCDIKATADCFWEILSRQNLYNDYPSLLSDGRREALIKQYLTQAKLIEDSMKREGCSTFQGSIEALSLLFDTSEKEKRDRKYRDLIPIYTKAAELGDSFSMFRIGYIYDWSLENHAEALGWYNRAMTAGYDQPEFFYEFASCYKNYGPKRYSPEWDSVLSDLNLKWRDATERYFDSQSRGNLLTYIHALRKEKGKDHFNKARDACQRAIALNRPDFGPTFLRHGIRHELIEILYEMGDYKAYLENTYCYLQEIREGPDPCKKYMIDFLCVLVKHHFEGLGVEKDYGKAKVFLDELLSYDKNNPLAIYYLAQYYEEGLCGIDPDSKLAFDLYSKIDDFNAEVAKKLGKMYLYGHVCKKDKRKARMYLEIAKAKGLEVSPYLEDAKSWF